MDSIVKYILNKSKLEITLIQISNATHDSFVMGIESRVTGTGPIGATMQPMEVDLTFQGRCFGKYRLPEVKTSSGGTAVNVYDQVVRILDMNCFMAFVKSLMNDEELSLTLDNGDCVIKAMGMTGRCTYRKDVQLKGMRGPPTKLKETTHSTNTVLVRNQSAVQIDHGVSVFEIQDNVGNVIAELKGPLEIVRGDFYATMNIDWKGVRPSSQEGVLVGRKTEGNAWTCETVKYIQTPLQFTSQFLGVCHG